MTETFWKKIREFLEFRIDPNNPGKSGFQKITCTQAATFSLTRAPVSLVVFQIPRLWRVSPENVGFFGEMFTWPFFWKQECGSGILLVVVLNICLFSYAYLARWSNLSLTNMFSTGWLNYQLEQLEMFLPEILFRFTGSTSLTNWLGLSLSS